MKLRVNSDITFEKNTVNAQLHSPHGPQKRLSSRSAARDLIIAITNDSQVASNYKPARDLIIAITNDSQVASNYKPARDLIIAITNDS